MSQKPEAARTAADRADASGSEGRSLTLIAFGKLATSAISAPCTHSAQRERHCRMANRSAALDRAHTTAAMPLQRASHAP
ncbi:hypothetical protein [Xanthomonas sp. F4]